MHNGWQIIVVAVFKSISVFEGWNYKRLERLPSGKHHDELGKKSKPPWNMPYVLFHFSPNDWNKNRRNRWKERFRKVPKVSKNHIKQGNDYNKGNSKYLGNKYQYKEHCMSINWKCRCISLTFHFLALRTSYNRQLNLKAHFLRSTKAMGIVWGARWIIKIDWIKYWTQDIMI